MNELGRSFCQEAFEVPKSSFHGHCCLDAKEEKIATLNGFLLSFKHPVCSMMLSCRHCWHIAFPAQQTETRKRKETKRPRPLKRGNDQGRRGEK